MRERGGPTTESGILYQNSVAALYLGRLCDDLPRPEAKQVVHVRFEAPEHVDDAVVTYGDGHVVYIQAKETIQEDEKAWKALWKDLWAQHSDKRFQKAKDRLRIHFGEAHDNYFAVREMCNRAGSTTNPEEWLERLTEPQNKLLKKIRASVDPENTADSTTLHEFLANVEVEIWPLRHIEDDLSPYWMPGSNLLPQVLFRLLRDRIGGKARHRGSYDSAELLQSLASEKGVELYRSPTTEVVLQAVRESGGILRQHKDTFGRTGTYLSRPVVAKIVEWALAPHDSSAVAFLLDNAGRGKTVVMRHALEVLQERGAEVLAIKADQQLSGITEPADLQKRLNLPEPVVRVAARLASDGPMVVLIDQLDALSLSLARDQRALNVVLATVGHLRMIPGVAVVVSCRTFDRNTNPRLKHVAVDQEFSLPLLDEADVGFVLEKLAINPDTLTPATIQLLRTPLHLDLFARVVQVREKGVVSLQGLKSLQDLYAALWEDLILGPSGEGPSAADREAVLRVLTQRMNERQRTSVPRSTLHSEQAPELTTAAEWLASAGVLVGSPTEWTFLHQTFFDYCYARFFAESGGSLSASVLDSDQGLFARPQLIQVLSYLRGIGDLRYLADLSTLFTAATLRRHVRDLLLRWMGALPDPTEHEWALVRRLLAVPEEKARVLRAISGNAGWFARIRGDTLNALLAGDTEFVDGEVIWYLISLLEVSQADVVMVMDNWLDRQEPWATRARDVITRVRAWSTPEAIAFYERVLRATPLDRIRHFFEIDEIAQVDAVAAARLLHFVLDAALDEALQDSQPDDWWRGIDDKLEKLETRSTGKAAGLIASNAPEEFLAFMIPWLERAMAAAPSPPSDLFIWYHQSDALSRSWNRGVGNIVAGFRTALETLGSKDPNAFATWIARLEALPYVTPQEILARVYATLAPSFAPKGLSFLLADARRLRLGEKGYHARQLIEAVSEHLSDEEIGSLEQHIISTTGRILPWHNHSGALRQRGLDQMHLLQALPRNRLSRDAKRLLAELERKFPDSPPPVPVNPRRMAEFVGSPIDHSVVERMNDAAWLRAMAKYSGFTEHEAHNRGGARELARLLKEQVTIHPERYFKLALEAPNDLDDAYVEAFVEGLATSDASPELAFSVVRRFGWQDRPRTRMMISWSLGRIAERGASLPQDLLDLLTSWIRLPPGGDEDHWDQQSKDLSSAPMNTNRGAAFRAAMAGLSATETQESIARRWEWIEFATGDPSVVFRAGALEALADLLPIDEERAIHLFERLAAGFPRLRDAHWFHEFIYRGVFGHFSRLAPYIGEVMHATSDQARERGAELAVIGLLSPLALEDDSAQELARALADQAITGTPEWRRGAARVFASNLVDGPTVLCIGGIHRLMNDADAEVRRLAVSAIHELREEHLLQLRDFLLSLAGSWAVQEGLEDFAEYLWKHGDLDPEWALAALSVVLDNPHPQPEHGVIFAGEHLIRTVLRIYTDPIGSAALRVQAMDLFDRLMDKFYGPAWEALNEWDRQ